MIRLILIAAALAAASPANAFTTSNQMRVEAVGPVTFSVKAAGGQNGAIDFWCAAGEYAWRRLNASNNARIFRLSEPPRRGGQPIVFSLDPTGKASRTGLAVIGRDDGSLSVASARNQCAAARSLNERF
jgi:hypothetical protein